MDNLARCAMLAKQAGLSYGNWIAIYGEKEIKKKEEPIPDGWKPCEWCGKPFRGMHNKRFCDMTCRVQAYYDNNREKIIETKKMNYRKGKQKNEGSC
jgi:hypothetical protein